MRQLRRVKVALVLGGRLKAAFVSFTVIGRRVGGLTNSCVLCLFVLRFGDLGNAK